MSERPVSEYPLCAELRIDAEAIAQRLAWLGFGAAEAAIMAELRDALAPQLDALIELVHERIQGIPELAALLRDEPTIRRVKRAQHTYFLALTGGEYGLAYAEQRLRVGLTHARIGLTPAWFLGAYQHFLAAAEALIAQAPLRREVPQQARRAALDKLVFFDLALTLEAYFHASHAQTQAMASYVAQVLDQIPAGVAVLDAEKRVRTANLALKRMLGLEEMGDLRGQSVDKLMALPGLDFAATQGGRAEPAPARFELTRAGAKGAQHFHVASSGIRLDERDHVLLVLQDVTRLRRAQDELRRFRTAIDASADAIFLIDRALGRIIDVNETACRLYAYPRGELIGADLPAFHPELDLTRFATMVEHLEAGAEAVEVTESLARRRNGEAFPVELDLCLAYFGNERILVVVARDISERRLAERELAQRNAEVESILHNALVGIVVIAQGRIQRANRKVAELLATTVETLQGRPAEQIFDTKTLAHMAQTHALHADGSEASHSAELRMTRATGERFWANVSATLLKADEPEAGSIWVIEDISARKEAENAVRKAQTVLEQRVADRTKELREINQELESFSYSISHDLRAPLRAINGFSEILALRYDSMLDPSGRDLLARVRAAAQRMDEQIEGLLQLSRVSQSPLDKKEVDLSQMASDILAELARAEPQRRVAIDVQPALKGSGDRALLQLVLQNLLANAWKYSQRRETAHIEFGAVPDEGGELVYHVRDDGAGFDMNHAGRLFGAFQRLHRPEDFPGHGIGLATTKRIIVRHGGSIWAESKPEAGATFYFTLG